MAGAGFDVGDADDVGLVVAGFPDDEQAAPASTRTIAITLADRAALMRRNYATARLRVSAPTR
jgi:hypothetical protein